MIWKCPVCGFTFPLFERYFWKCPVCGNPLHIEYNATLEREESRNVWQRFRGMLPFVPEKYRGEGLTPLVNEKFGAHTLMFKLEYLNPSGSFKDRGTALAIAYASKLGYKRVADDTSGNTGLSISLYSRLYDLKADIVMPRTAPEGKKKLVRRFGSTIIETPSRGEAGEKVLELAGRGDVFYVAHTWNYFYIIGASTIPMEIAEEDSIPDIVIAPIGSGGLFLGLVKGFEVLLKMGITTKMPVFFAVQGYSAQPVFKEFKGYEQPGEESNLADGIMVPKVPRLKEIVDALKKYGGDVILVGNSEINRAYELLWQWGFAVEPTSAASFAAFEKIKGLLNGSRVLLVLTGSGLKFI